MWSTAQIVFPDVLEFGGLERCKRGGRKEGGWELKGNKEERGGLLLPK